MLRLLTIVLAVAVSVAIVASPVAADGPTKTEFTFTGSGVLTDICPFPVTVDVTITGTETDFVDQSGALTRISIHTHQQDTFSANGKTLVGIPYTTNAAWLYDRQGNLIHQYGSGIIEKAWLPDGSLFISAGRVDLLARPLGFALTPDHGRSGNLAEFCAALAP